MSGVRTHVVVDFVACRECEFVLVADVGEEPTPKRVDECPECGSSEFRFTGE